MHANKPWIKGLLLAVTLGLALSATAQPPAKIAPLQGPIKLAPPVQTLPVLPPPDTLNERYERFREVAARAKAARDALVTAREQCAARSFSVQDQRQARCLESDTVAQCNDKLESWCTIRESLAFRRQNRVLARAAEQLNAAVSAYVVQVRQLPAAD